MSAQIMLAALACSSMDRLDVVNYFKAMKKEGRLQVLLHSSILCACVLSLCVCVWRSHLLPQHFKHAGGVEGPGSPKRHDTYY